MRQRQLASVLFPVIGVFIAISGLPRIVLAIGLAVPSTEASAVSRVDSAYAVTLLIGTLVAVLLGIVLVAMRERLAERLFTADAAPPAAQDAQAVALSVLGCYFGIEAIPRLVAVGRFGRIEWEAVAQLVGRSLVSRGPRSGAPLDRSAGSRILESR